MCRRKHIIVVRGLLTFSKLISHIVSYKIVYLNEPSVRNGLLWCSRLSTHLRRRDPGSNHDCLSLKALLQLPYYCNKHATCNLHAATNNQMSLQQLCKTWTIFCGSNCCKFYGSVITLLPYLILSAVPAAIILRSWQVKWPGENCNDLADDLQAALTYR